MQDNKMIIETIVTGFLEENCYVIIKGNKCLVVDPGDDYLKIKEKIGNNKVIGVLITHSHADHIGALRHFLTSRTIKIFKKSSTQEKEYEIGDFKFKVIFTPGHSIDSISFYFEEEKIMFVGDFIFKNTIGRCDLPGGNEKQMKESLEKIKTYSDNITLYPGHGEITNLKAEKENNEFLK